LSLNPGTRLGVYEVTAQIGLGGMGEVYRATDSNLKRSVAIKVLPASVAGDADRLARFQREAEVLAALNHPNIAAIYGLERTPDFTALVMELVEGDDLSERIAKGAIPLDEALPIAKQIADALEAAHEQGIIHRDLKPANIKVRSDGTVKVLDFGLAKATEAASGTSLDFTHSPTLTSPAMVTGVGVILGTAAYMAPEQAHGRSADRRADIWSFGTVLYEMLTGELAFKGESVSDTLASVLKLEPPWDRLPAATPAVVRSLLRRCLTKDPKQRLQAIGEARIAIDNVPGANSEYVVKPMSLSSPSRFGVLGWVATAVTAGVATAVIAGVALWGWSRSAVQKPLTVIRLATTFPTAHLPGTIALSRDGSRLAFAGGPRQQIYVRMIDQFDARPLPGTEGAVFLCFSPDGEWISYIAGSRPGQQLKRIAVAGGPVQTLTDAVSQIGPPVQNWGADDNILFSTNGVLTRIRSGGGTPETVATPDYTKGEQFYAGAQLLPSDHGILVTIHRGGGNTDDNVIVVLNPRTKEKKVVLEHAGIAQYVSTGPVSTAGHLVYYDPRTASLLAVPFDADRLAVRGSPVPVVDAVRSTVGPFGDFSISDSGTLVYVPGTAKGRTASTLVWVDRAGTEQQLGAPPRAYGSNLTAPRLSPDGHRIAVTIAGDSDDVWVYDQDRGTLERVTSEGNSRGPVWTPDGKRLVYERSPGADSAVLSVPVDSSAAPSVIATQNKASILPSSISPDGRLMLGFFPIDKGLWVLDLVEGAPGGPKLRPFLDSKFAKFNPSFSPDGKWVAYRSDETGRSEIYVTPYPGPGGRFQISTDGGQFPRWAGDGRELFYRNQADDKMMAVEIQTEPTFRAGKPTVLFERRYGNGYDVSPDGKRFLMVKPAGGEQAPTDQLNVVLNWFEELKARVPAR
jgi:eukaryotic-like serine/threonine-protein kinase